MHTHTHTHTHSGLQTARRWPAGPARCGPWRLLWPQAWLPPHKDTSCLQWTICGFPQTPRLFPIRTASPSHTHNTPRAPQALHHITTPGSRYCSYFQFPRGGDRPREARRLPRVTQVRPLRPPPSKGSTLSDGPVSPPTSPAQL